MSWLRMDDGFAIHPKILMLTRAERWTWMEVLCYCARYKTEGHIPESIGEAIPKASRDFVSKCGDIGLLDYDAEHGSYWIHDWQDYNPKDATGATRQMRVRNKARNGDVPATVTGDAVTKVTPRARASRPVPNKNNPSFLPTSTADGKEGGFEIGKILKEVDAA